MDKGKPKDSSEGRATKADDEAYNLIMRDKERLLVHERAAAVHLQPFGAA